MIIDKLKSAAKSFPDRIAYKVKNDFITYSELISRAEKYSLLLKKQGSSPVIIYGHKEISVIVSILSCLFSGRAYVPVDSSTPILRIQKIARLTKSTLVLTDNNTDSKSLCIENAEICSLSGLEKFKSNEEKETYGNTAYIIFTSGSTGEPKGVPVSTKNLGNFVDWISNLSPLRDYTEANVLNQASFSFDLSVADLYYSLCKGHTLTAFEGNSGDGFDRLFEIFADEKINVAVMTPTFIKLCLLNGDFNEKNYPHLKCVYFCGEPLENKTAQKLLNSFPSLKIINAYGPTEATSAVSAILITREIIENEPLLPVGDLDSLATEVEIIDGEIVLKGNSVFSGYLGNSAGGYYKENGVNCYKTGDLGFKKDGKLYCKGRKDSQIKFKGYRIELNEIEFHLSQISGVKECAVIAKRTPDGIVKTIKAFVAPENLTADYIRAELLKSLPEYMLPKAFKFAKQLPINKNGKIDRRALSEL